MCDDCRFGAAGFDIQGLVLWDFGAGAEPAFVDQERWVDSGTIGAFTFKYGSQQYLIARVSPQCQGNALVTFDGVQPGDLGFSSASPTWPACRSPSTPASGSTTGFPATKWWAPSTCSRAATRDVHMYSVRIRGGHPRLTPEGEVIKAVWILDHGMDLVADPPAPWPPFAVSAYTDGLKVWDLSDPTRRT